MRRSQKYRGGRGMDQYAVAAPAPDPVNQELVRAERACPGEDQLCGMTPCRLVIIYSHFRGASCLHIQDNTNKLPTNTVSYPTTHHRSIFLKCDSWLYNKHTVLGPKYTSGNNVCFWRSSICLATLAIIMQLDRECSNIYKTEFIGFYFNAMR